jgi:hypothetical protein
MSELESASAAEAPSCPKCQGPMWDNREGKRNPKAPDFKCKNKECDGVIWPPRTAAAGAPAAAGASAAPQPGMPSCPSCGGAMWDDRASKRNPRAPDFKCRNRPKFKGGPGCEGVIWPPRDGSSSPYPAATGSPQRSATSAPSGPPPRDTAPPPDDADFDPNFGGDDDDLPF